MDIVCQLMAEFIGFIIEFIKLLPIMLFVFEFKLQSKSKIIIFGVCASIFLVVSALLGLSKYAPMYTYTAVILTILLLKGKKRILFIIITYLAICILDMLSAVVWLLINNKPYSLLANDFNMSLLINAISIILIVLICVIFKIFSSKHRILETYNISSLYLVLIIMGELSLLAFITVFQLNDNAIDGAENVMSLGLSVGSIVFIVTAFSMLINNVSRNHYKNISQINEKIIENQERYYSMLLQKEEETRKFRHDIKNHLNCMHMLFSNEQYDELENYFEKMGVSLIELRSNVQTGNDMVSAILTDISVRFPTVPFSIEGKMANSLRLTNMDICTIFYNLFDNAFSAAQKSEHKSVTILIRYLDKNLYFSIVNTVMHKVEINDNRLTTEKQDKQNHGYGAVNAVNCAQKNGGTLSFSCTDTHFTAELILPNVNC